MTFPELANPPAVGARLARRRRHVSSSARLAVLLLALAPRPGGAQAASSGPLSITWIDAEGGAATLVVTPAGESLLIDAGWPGERDAERIAAAARAAGVERIDHCVITHFHTDHLGGVPDLVRLLPVGRFWDPGVPEDPEDDVKPGRVADYLRAAGDRRTVLRPGDLLPLEGVRVEVVCAGGRVLGDAEVPPSERHCTAEPPHPGATSDDDSENRRSVGLLLSLGDFRFLALGDLPWAYEHALACPVDRVGPVDVLQASHHGHHESNDPALLAALRARVIVVDNGPEKGCTSEAFPRLTGAPGLEALYQLHRNLLDEASNTAPARIANDAADCAGEPVRLTLLPGVPRYVVAVPAKGTREEFALGRR